MSKKCDRAVFKMKGRPTLFVPLKEVDVATASGNLHDGLGQSRHGYFWLKLHIIKIKINIYIDTCRETLSRQKKQAEAAAARKRKAGLGLGGGACNKKVFEDLERRADEEAARFVVFLQHLQTLVRLEASF